MAGFFGVDWGDLGDGGSLGLEPCSAGVEGGVAGGSGVSGESGTAGVAAAAGNALAVVLLTLRLAVVRREEGCRGVGVAMEAESNGRDQVEGSSEGRA
jgi:hypothetical protein